MGPWSTVFCITCSAILWSSGLAQKAAVVAPHGAYLGCFKLAADPSLKVEAFDSDSFQDCAPNCVSQDYAFAMISPDYKCRCSSIAPDAALQLPYTDCLKGKTGIAVFYQHKDAGTTQCRLAEVPMAPDFWKISYGTRNLNFTGVDAQQQGTLAVKLNSTVGARLITPDGQFAYGLYQVDAKISGATGVVTAFYTRSTDVYPNSVVEDFSEIDFEWCNAKPCKQNSVWLNTSTRAKSNGERQVNPDDYQPKIGSDKRTDTDFITYAINWQPDFVSWFMDGKLMHIMRNGENNTWYNGDPITNPDGTRRTFQSPNLASHVTISMWTDTRDNPDDIFGGIIDLTKGPYYSYFRQLRRVLCDKPLPAGDNATCAMGPAWLYGKRETRICVDNNAIDQVAKIRIEPPKADPLLGTQDRATRRSTSGAGVLSQHWGNSLLGMTVFAALLWV